jgi:hypothetical protein
VLHHLLLLSPAEAEEGSLSAPPGSPGAGRAADRAAAGPAAFHLPGAVNGALPEGVVKRLCVRWLAELIIALWHDLQVGCGLRAARPVAAAFNGAGAAALPRCCAAALLCCRARQRPWGEGGRGGRTSAAPAHQAAH